MSQRQSTAVNFSRLQSATSQRQSTAVADCSRLPLIAVNVNEPLSIESHDNAIRRDTIADTIDISVTLVTMSVIVNYFKQECKLVMLGLEHPKPTDFYISTWQNTRSAVPLLLWRLLLLLTSVGIVITSFTFYIISPFSAGYWFIYLTHWGLGLMVASTGFGVATSARVYLYGPISADLNLPWFVKTFWVLHNVSVPVAFIITVFYWSLLYNVDFQEEMDRGLDIAVHAVNTVIMLLMLMSSSHPTRFLHVAHPFLFALTYVVFSVIYYLAGGINPLGEPWIYPVVHWGEPGPTILVVFVTGLLLVCLHFVTIGLAAARDILAGRIMRSSAAAGADENVALRNNAANT
ncbi:protein rolling stone [Bicyclus anynana]|uniref:Protein rolling stone n=1 Tax=Bicyclus anynana TaxID=110368 RepID=A0ABM3LFW6_BICAN|nr:protein rolling stone [Bicyclus anynana]